MADKIILRTFADRMLIYNLGAMLVRQSYRLVWACPPVQRFLGRRYPKLLKHVMGQQGLTETVAAAMSGNAKPVCWFHAASFGEYNVIRPIVKQIRKDDVCIVVTFFSSTGYEMLTAQNKRTNEADHVFYLPLDTTSNARRFLDLLKPQKAVFAISEYWMNHLNELKARHIPTYIVSMLVGNGSYLLKWYGFPLRKALRAVSTFMVLDEPSRQNLGRMGFTNVVVTGDPLFDNAIAIAREPYHNTIVERFCGGSRQVFVAGSISDQKDLGLVAALANANRDVRFIVVPHEIGQENLKAIVGQMGGRALLYSQCSDATSFDGVQTLVVDSLGSLARLYRYGSWAYVGGGFTPYLHSVIEPVVYGIPVVFGPRIERKRTPQQMISLGVGAMVETESSLLTWFDGMRHPETLQAARTRAAAYVDSNANATMTVVEEIKKTRNKKIKL